MAKQPTKKEREAAAKAELEAANVEKARAAEVSYPAFLTLVEIANATVDENKSENERFAYMSVDMTQELLDKKFIEMNTGLVSPDDANDFAVRATEAGLTASGLFAAELETNSVKPVETASAAIEGTTPVSDVVTATASTPAAPATVAASVGTGEGATLPADAAAARTRKAHVAVDAGSIVTGSGLPPAAQPGRGVGRKSLYPFLTLAAPVLNDAGQPTSMSFFFVPNVEGREDMARSLNATVSGQNKKSAATNDAKTGKPAVFKVYEIEQAGVKGAGVYRVQ